MFTGLVETKGFLRGRDVRGRGARLKIGTSLSPLVLGESIAVQGVCLTVDSIVTDGFECDASAETLARSTLAHIRMGAVVHLERAMPLGGRMGGHIVTGHVDDRVRLQEKAELGEALRLSFSMESSLAPMIAPKGSVAIDGVSLTVNAVGPASFEVVVIPHTLASTSLGSLSLGDEANLEIDLLARYVARLLQSGASKVCESSPQVARDETLLTKLKAAGYL